MADLTSYINGFHGLGSKATVKKNQKELLIRLFSYEPQTLTASQRIQVLLNLGLSADNFGKTGKVALVKGTHDIVFEESFTAPYSVIATGSTSSSSVVVVVTDDSDLTKFTIKVSFDCTVRWSATLIT